MASAISKIRIEALVVFLLWICSGSFAKERLSPFEVPEAKIAIIVCPGGSYSWLDYQTEGSDVAEWLRQNGISAFVLRYRVQGGFAFASGIRFLIRGHRHPDPIEDLQAAIAIVRSKGYKKVGVMGFSAGGHLVMSSSYLHGTNGYDNERPDFIVPIYPVVTLSEFAYVHKRSRRALLGEYRKLSHTLRDSLSLEKHVPADCPPVFLVNCIDDPIVHFHNSELLDSALSAQQIPHRYLQYSTGGHGFGTDSCKTSVEAIAWKVEFLEWLKELSF